MEYIGDFAEDATVNFFFTTNDSSGGAVAPSDAFEAADVAIYKDNSATQKTTANGITMTSPFDAVVGLHQISIDTSNDTGDAGFWTTGNDFTVVLNPDTETVDGQTVVSVLGQFGLENRAASGGGGPTVAQIADGVWDELRAGHSTADTYGEFTGDAAMRGTDGANTVVPLAGATDQAEHDATQADIAALNDLSAAQVNAEVDTALTDVHLDHLLAVDYDPASPPGVGTALLNELVEDDGGVSRYTANALEQAPTGGSAPTADQIADAVWDEDIVAAHGTADTSGEIVSQLTKRAVTFSAEVVDGSVLGQMADDGIAVFDRTTDSLQAISDSGGGGLTQQQVRDSMKLTPTAGAPAAGSVDTHLDDIEADTQNIQSRLPASLSNGRMRTDALPVQNQAFADIPFQMVDAIDRFTAETGLTPTAERSIDGAAFAAAAGTVTEVGDGVYHFDATAADMNGEVVVIRFVAAGAADALVPLRTTPP